jgi:hypothetical protein
MKLRHGKSNRDFQHNIRVEMKRGNDTRKAVGIAFGEASLARAVDAKERAMYHSK